MEKPNRGAGREMSTHEIVEALQGKRALLQWWEQQPTQVQLTNMDYLHELSDNIRRLQKYLEHRKNSPI